MRFLSAYFVKNLQNKRFNRKKVVFMDEDYFNARMSAEHERMEREAKVITRGCGLLSLVVAIVVTAVIILYKLFIS